MSIDIRSDRNDNYIDFLENRIKELLAERQVLQEELAALKKKYQDFSEDPAAGYFQSTPEGRHLAANPAFADILDFDRKGIEDTLSAAEKKFFAPFNYSPVSMALSHLDSGIFVDVNEAFLSVHGFERNELIGHSALELGLWLDQVEHDGFYKKLKENGKVNNYEIRTRNKQGTLITALLFGVIIDLNAEKYVLTSKVNISELRQYQTEMSRLEIFNLIGEMSAGIAHEIRNPLTTIKGFLQLLENKREYYFHKEYFSLMISELDRANNIITEFLSLVKNKPVKKDWLNLNLIILNLLPLIEADAFNTDNYIETDCDQIKPLFADDKEMRQLILNLIRNGLEAMPPGKTLTIRTRMENGMVVLSVIDQGNGLTPEAMEKIGTPFFTTKDKGTGLGLATCYSIAARHNASIDFETGLNGTTFHVRFKLE